MTLDKLLELLEQHANSYNGSEVCLVLESNFSNRPSGIVNILYPADIHEAVKDLRQLRKTKK